MEKALACEIVSRTFSGRSTDSRQEPTHVEPTVRAEGAKSFCSPERGDPAKDLPYFLNRNIYSSEGTLLQDIMSAPVFSTPGMCAALNEPRLRWAHSKRRLTISKRRFEVSPPR